MGENYVKSGDQKKADECFEKVIEYCVKTEQSEENASRCFGKVSEYYRRQGQNYFYSGNQKKADECFEKALGYYQREGEVSGDRKKADEYSEEVRRYHLQIKLGYLPEKGLPLVILLPGSKQRYVKGGCVIKPHEYRLEMK